MFISFLQLIPNCRGGKLLCLNLQGKIANRFLGHVHLYSQFSAGCKAPICCIFLLGNSWRYSLVKTTASGAFRLAEILPVKVKMAHKKWFTIL